MYGSKRVAVRDLNPHILCALCGGYLIQATTVIECLHSFCRSCIVNFLETSKVCPICDAQIHKTRPLLNIRPDQTLQSLVYKLVPGLFQDEMRRRREFHATLSESDLEDLSLEERGEASLEKEFKPGDDHVSLILQLAFREGKSKPFEVRDRRYLLCPSEVTVQHLKKFIRMKFHLNESYKIEMYRAREELSDDLMLQDIALIYSWRGDRPMNLCYTITEPPKARPAKCLKQTELVSKQSDVCHTPAASPAGKGPHPEIKLRHAVCSPEVDLSPVMNSTSDAILTPVSDTNASKSASSSPLLETMIPLSIVLPVTSLSPSSISTTSCSDTASDILPSAGSNVSSTLSNNQKSETAVNPHVANNAKALLSLPFGCNVSKQPSADSIPAVASSTNTTSQPKPGLAKQEVSKLMHSVESILSKTPKRNHHKNKSKTLTWTPASEILAASGNLCKEKNDKTASKTAKHKLEEHVGELPKRSVVSDSQTVEGADHPISGFKRSQSVIETDVDGHQQRSQEAVSNNHADNGNGLTHTEATTDPFFSYIPKFQKHKKLCAVKRSVSYEGPSVTPVLGIATCDAMEKRNWKKRKLSTLDFDSSKVTAVGSCPVSMNNVVSASEVNTSTHNHHKQTLSEDTVRRSASQLTVHLPPGTEKNSLQLGSAGSMMLSSTSHTIPFPGTCLPVLLPQGNSTVSSQERPQSRNNVLDPKVKSSSRKSNHTSSATATNKSNRTSCDMKISDSTHANKVSKSKKQSRIVDSDSESSKVYINKKSLGYIMNKSNKSVSSNCVSSFARGSSSGKSVEEISVDICTSPSEVSNVTSPTAYVTSPGTEDRTDNSTLPEIQTPCVNNCVVTFPAKIVPLDLSSKKK